MMDEDRKMLINLSTNSFDANFSTIVFKIYTFNKSSNVRSDLFSIPVTDSMLSTSTSISLLILRKVATVYSKLPAALRRSRTKCFCANDIPL